MAQLAEQTEYQLPPPLTLSSRDLSDSSKQASSAFTVLSACVAANPRPALSAKHKFATTRTVWKQTIFYTQLVLFNGHIHPAPASMTSYRRIGHGILRGIWSCTVMSPISSPVNKCHTVTHTVPTYDKLSHCTWVLLYDILSLTCNDCTSFNHLIANNRFIWV